MRVGDLLEWLAATAFVVGGYLASGRAWVAVLVAGLCLAYFAQCYSTHPIKLRKGSDQ